MDEPEATIIGGGLHGTLLALALARAGLRVRLCERGPTLGGNHLWCLHDTDLLDDRERCFLAPFVVKRWPDHEIRFPNLQRTIPGGYAAVSSARLHEVALPELLERNADVLLNAEAGTASAGIAFDSRGPEHAPIAPCGWQKFLGQELRFAEPHGWTRPLLMDATVEQHDGYRFVYVLPFDDTRAMVEDTYYSDTPDLDVPTLRQRLAAYVGPRAFEIEREETGALPIPLAASMAFKAGDSPSWKSFWVKKGVVADGRRRLEDANRRISPAPHPNPPPETGGGRLTLGYAGGFLHPTTGYSLPLAVRCAVRLAEQPPERWGETLDELRWGLAGPQAFCRMLNRLLFRGYHPEGRWQVLERFHRVMPDDAIGRFYGLRPTLADRARLMVGRPPRGFSLPRFMRESWKAWHA